MKYIQNNIKRFADDTILYKVVHNIDQVTAEFNIDLESIQFWAKIWKVDFMDLLCFCSVLCLLCLCARLFICALWSPAGKRLTSWLSFVVSTVSLSLPIGILGQVWCLIVSIPDLCTLTYFNPLKSKSLLITKKNQNIQHPPLIMPQSQIEEVNEHKHLGITLCRTLTWTNPISEKSTKAWKIIGSLRHYNFFR